MARRELKRSLRPASCCKVEVMNGAAGERRKGFSVRDLTVKPAPWRPLASERASCSSRTTTEPGAVRVPVCPKSRPEARATPSTAASEAVNEFGEPWAAGVAVVKVASMPHHPAGRNSIRPRSRSTTIRVATLCTRPAESRGMIFFHRTGDTSYP